jgi:hypothetical protein
MTSAVDGCGERGFYFDGRIDVEIFTRYDIDLVSPNSDRLTLDYIWKDNYHKSFKKEEKVQVYIF